MIINVSNFIDSAVMEKHFIRLINQIYKILPLREESGDWENQLENCLLEISGMANVFKTGQSELLLALCKLEGLRNSDIDDFSFELFRKNIFDCISLLESAKKTILEYSND